MKDFSSVHLRERVSILYIGTATTNHLKHIPRTPSRTRVKDSLTARRPARETEQQVWALRLRAGPRRW
ncbi:hypothetical protein MPL3356_270019 [Mesorhizobium plurifarium]|uniref:Uncharacterized protein n=1 Tax=Mesorhizobium plurifarium TaxID=69974 RepID=A0A090DP42_MESPL|nr:hypothetical protein MPLB_1460051 [Mesorhizobium sp. ORS 3324]CDX18233.1 hypothetical protein MPL3356_270019 [Mesorhizobium plurifarium]